MIAPSSRAIKARSKVESRALLTSDEYVGDQWLDDDIGTFKGSKRKRQIKDQNGILSTSGIRNKKSKTDSPPEGVVMMRKNSDSKSSKSRRRRTLSSDSDGDSDCNSEVFGPVTSGRDHRVAAKFSDDDQVDLIPDLPGKNSRKRRNETVMPLTSGQRSEPAHDLFQCESEGEDDFTVEEFPNLTSPNSMSDRTVSNNACRNNNNTGIRNNTSKPAHQPKITSFGVQGKQQHSQTQQKRNTNSSISPRNALVKPTTPIAPVTPVTTPTANTRPGFALKLRIKVKDRQILVPIPNGVVDTATFGWLSEETSRRYYQLCNLKPVLSLTTPDGAMFTPDDNVLEFCQDNDEVTCYNIIVMQLIFL